MDIDTQNIWAMLSRILIFLPVCKNLSGPQQSHLHCMTVRNSVKLGDKTQDI